MNYGIVFKANKKTFSEIIHYLKLFDNICIVYVKECKDNLYIIEEKRLKEMLDFLVGKSQSNEATK